MNKLPSHALHANRKPLRIAIWHVDGYSLTASSRNFSGDDSYGINKNSFIHSSRLSPKMTFDQRKPSISKFLSSVVKKIDAFVIIGADKNTVSHPAEICDVENLYDCAVSACNNNSSVFIFVPKKEKMTTSLSSTRSSRKRNNNNNNKKKSSSNEDDDNIIFAPHWQVETLPGACGQHMKFTYVDEENETMNDYSSQPSEIKSSFDELVKKEKSLSKNNNIQEQEDDESLQKGKEQKKQKQSIFVNCCFLDLSLASRNSANTASKNMNNNNNQKMPTIFSLDSNLGISSSFQDQLLKTKQQTKNASSTGSSSSDLNENEKRLNDYFSHVSTSTDLVAGHLRHFRFGDASVNKTNSGVTRIWNDAFLVTGRKQESKFTFDPELNLEKYFDLGGGDKNNKMKFLLKEAGPARRSDRFLVRDSSDIFCKDISTVKFETEDGLLASCNLPVIAEFNVPPRWIF